MLTLKKINYRILTNDDFCGLHLSIVEQTNSISNNEVLPLIERYRNSVNEYSKLIGRKFNDPVSKEVQRLDKERNSLVTSCRFIVIGLKNYPDETVRESVKDLLTFFENNKNNPRRLNQSRSSSVIGRLIDLMKELDENILNKFGLVEILKKLESTENQFLKTYGERSSIYSTRVCKDRWGDRQECLDSFKLLTDLCLIKSNLNNDDECTQFINSINVLINNRKQMMKTNEKKKELGTSCEPSPENIETENKEVKDVI